MDVERGTVTGYIIPARQLAGETHYLFVFQKKDRPTFYQYSITTNTGSSGLLVLNVEEKDNAEATDGEVTLEAGDWGVLVYAQGNGTNLDPASAGRRIHTEQIRVYSGSEEAPVYPPAPGGECEDATVTINGTEVATPASGATAALVVRDQDGNQVGSWNGSQWVVTIPEEDMPYIAAVYADEAEASLDNTTVPTDTQAIKVGTRLYQGDGESTSAELIATMTYNPSVTENDVNPWLTTVGGQVYEVQLNAQ